MIPQLEYGQATLEEVQFEWGRNGRAVRQKPNVQGKECLHLTPVVREAKWELLEDQYEVAMDLTAGKSEYSVATVSRHITMLAEAVLEAPIELRTAKHSMNTKTSQHTMDTIGATRPTVESKPPGNTIYFCRSCSCSICNTCLSQSCLSHKVQWIPYSATPVCGSSRHL